MEPTDLTVGARAGRRVLSTTGITRTTGAGRTGAGRGRGALCHDGWVRCRRKSLINCWRGEEVGTKQMTADKVLLTGLAVAIHT